MEIMISWSQLDDFYVYFVGEKIVRVRQII